MQRSNGFNTRIKLKTRLKRLEDVPGVLLQSIKEVLRVTIARLQCWLLKMFTVLTRVISVIRIMEVFQPIRSRKHRIQSLCRDQTVVHVNRCNFRRLELILARLR